MFINYNILETFFKNSKKIFYLFNLLNFLSFIFNSTKKNKINLTLINNKNLCLKINYLFWLY